MAEDRANQELNEAFKQSGLVNFLNTVLLVLEILRIFAWVNVICLPISFQTDPLGLIQRFTKKENESDEQAWNRCFCCIFDILWVCFLSCLYCIPCNFMTKPYNSAFNFPLLLDTWLCVLLPLSPDTWRVLLCSLVFVYCAIIFVLFSALQVTIYKVYLLVNLLRSFDDFWFLYARVCETSLSSLRHFVAQDTTRLNKVVMRTALSEFDLSSVCVLSITFKCQYWYIIKVFLSKLSIS